MIYIYTYIYLQKIYLLNTYKVNMYVLSIYLLIAWWYIYTYGTAYVPTLYIRCCVRNRPSAYLWL